MSDGTAGDQLETKSKAKGLSEGLYGPEALKGIKSEVMAGCVLSPKDDADRAWNDANRRAARIISQYIKGAGLFQL